MTILVTGSGGQVGTELLRRAQRRQIAVIGLARHALDIADPSAIERELTTLPVTLVVNAAAYTAVDRAETERDTAFAANCDGPANLAAYCAQREIPLIHISTDYVFDGTRREPYNEDDPVNPLGVYGASKAAGEQAVRERLSRHVILRTAWVYSAHGHNFVKTMLRLGSERDEIGVVDDQIGCPTAAGEIAEAILSVATRIQSKQTPRWGTYHYCAAGQASWYEFACKIFQLAARHRRYRAVVKPIPSSAYPTPVRRPANSVLDCTKFQEAFGLNRRPWPEPLEEMLDEINKNK